MHASLVNGELFSPGKVGPPDSCQKRGFLVITLPFGAMLHCHEVRYVIHPYSGRDCTCVL